MAIKRNIARYAAWWSPAVVVLVLLAANACSRPATQTDFRKIPAGQATAGFLSSYENLKPNPRFENTRTYVSADPAKNIHGYVAVIIDNPVVYISSDVPEGSIPTAGIASLKEYFHDAIDEAVEDAFPVVQSNGPLVLRLRSAIVGVDVGQQIPADANDTGALNRPLSIGRVGVEMELVDSQTGEQIAAVIDHQNLGAGAVIGSVNFSRQEKFRAATDAFDHWASRLRDFLDSAHELSPEDIQRVEQANVAYSSSTNRSQGTQGQ